MSLPQEFDHMLIKLGDQGTPEQFPAICGPETFNVNETANTTERFRRDCDNFNQPAQRRVKTNSVQFDVTASGGVNVPSIPDLRAALGFSRNYIIEGYQSDPTTSGGNGTLLATWEGPLVLTALNITADANGDSNAEMTFASDGPVTFTAV